jgi:GNAT superfamily N-acetyltransferase
LCELRSTLFVKLSVEIATEADAGALASLRTRVAEDLARLYGRGHWSWAVTDKGVLRGLKNSRVLVARDRRGIVATLRLATKKPWAIDPQYFALARRPLYLVDMAVEPSQQRHGIGRRLVEEAKAIARAWPSDAIRLDAYDGALGAGPFYARCGFREVGRVTYRRVPLVYFEWLVPGSEEPVASQV